MAQRSLTLFIILAYFVLIKDLLMSFIKLFLPREKLNIAGKTALVTGGGKGLGRQISFLLAKEGCNVVICGNDLEAAQRTSEEIKGKYGVFCEAFRVDVADVKQVEKLTDDIEKLNIGEVDILVNNAGIIAPIATLEGTNPDIDRIIDVNLKSHFWTVRTFLPSMIKRRQGSIVGISSILGLSAVPWTAAYSSSKFGVNGFYQSLIGDLQMKDYDEFINVSCLCFGTINSSDEFKELLHKIQIPFQYISVHSAAKCVIDAILNKTQFQIFPPSCVTAIIANYLPVKTRKFILKRGAKNVDVDACHQYFESRK